MTKERDTGHIFWLAKILFFVLLAYLAFHYARLTDFPIGDDPAIHIQTIRNTTYSGLLQTTYPIPLMIFKFFHEQTGVAAHQLFVWLISSFLFIAASALFLFVRKTTGDWRVAAVAAVLFVTARWVNDGLRMGLLAEVFGWSVLFLSLTAFASRQLLLTLLLTGLLAASHPFALLVFGLIIIFYSGVAMLSESRGERLFILKLLACYLIIAVALTIAKPELVQRFLSFVPADPVDWGNRSLWQIIAGDDVRRLFISLLACIGIVGSLKNWHEPFPKLSLLLLAVGLFFSLNYLFGIGFISFRFYVYLEAGLAIFAATALVDLVRQIQPSYALGGLLALVLGLLIAIPNHQVNQVIGRWQATNPDAKATMVGPDRAALDWIRANTTGSDQFIAERRHAIWIGAYADRLKVAEQPALYDEVLFAEASLALQPYSEYYAYYGFGQIEPTDLWREHERVYAVDGIRIWRKR